MIKKITFLTITLFAFGILKAQDYQISFTGSGQSTTIETIQVQNLTQGTSLKLNGSDVLHLRATVTAIDHLTASGDNSLQIYPNPMIGNSTIEFEIPKAGNVIIELYTITGEKVTSIQKSLQAGIQKFKVSGLNTGIYTVNVKTDNIFYSGKIISNGISNGNANFAFINRSTKEYNANLKSTKSIVPMQYNTGDRILLKAVSGIYSTIKTLVPVSSSIETFDFVAATDFDGNNYTTVTIGTQVWMVENLKVTHYRNGDPIPNITDNALWAALRDGAYCNYNNTINSNTIATYGRLYNWFTVADSRNIAPTGWHVPSHAEWITLTTTLLGELVAGGKMKETGTTHWRSPNTSATNESGFTALPSGYRYSRDGSFRNLDFGSYWWNSTAHSDTEAWDRCLKSNDTICYAGFDTRQEGFSLRLIKD